MKSISKMVKVEAKSGKWRQNVTSESRIESGSKMRKLNLKNFIILNPYLEMWKQSVESGSNM